MARVTQLVVDSRAPASLARFWAAALDDFEVRPYHDARIARLAGLGRTPQTDPCVILDGPAFEMCFQEVTALSDIKRAVHRWITRITHPNRDGLLERRQTSRHPIVHWNEIAWCRSERRSSKSSIVTHGCVTPRATTSALPRDSRRYGAARDGIAKPTWTLPAVIEPVLGRLSACGGHASARSRQLRDCLQGAGR